MKFFDLNLRVFTGIKLSGLFLGCCVAGGFCYFRSLRDKVYLGTVKEKKVDSNTAFGLETQTTPTENGTKNQRYCVDQQYFGSDTTNIPVTGTKVCVIGDTVTDKYDRQWLTPSTDYFSGIYTSRHPIYWIFKSSMSSRY